MKKTMIVFCQNGSGGKISDTTSSKRDHSVTPTGTTLHEQLDDDVGGDDYDEEEEEQDDDNDEEKESDEHYIIPIVTNPGIFCIINDDHFVFILAC